MSLQLQSEPLIASVNTLVRYMMSYIVLGIPVNPPEIVTVDGEEFKVNMDKMEINAPYFVDFLDSRYLIWKNMDGALVINEVA